MARSDLIKEMFYKNYSPLDFDFWKLQAPPLYSLVSAQDIAYIHNIITSPKYSSKTEYKNKAIDYVMRCRGFRKLHAGTNRVVYKHEEISNIVMKIPYREIALSDGPREYRNQFELQPFVTRIYEVSQCGTMALAERVQAITSIPEYMSMYDSIFELLVNKILGKYVLEDIGTEYFKNVGIRDGFGPVLLDFPIMYKLDGQKLYCNKIHLDGSVCDGIIDYDTGFNKLICKKCGQRYYASELGKNESENKIIKGFYSKGDCNVEICIRKGNKIVSESGKITSTIQSKVLDKIDVDVCIEGEKDYNITTVDKIITPDNNVTDDREEYIKLPRLNSDSLAPEYLNIESYGVYKLVTPLEAPEDVDYMNHPEEDDLKHPSKEDYNENGSFILDKEEEPKEPVDARTEYEDDESDYQEDNSISLY